MKRILYLLTALVVALSSGSAVFAQGNDPSGTQKVVVLQQVMTSPSFEAKDWPVTRVVTRQYIDPVTGKTVTLKTIFRDAPPGFGSVPKTLPCPDQNALVTTTCIYKGASFVSNQSFVGDVYANAAHYASHFCRDDSCSPNLYQPYRLEIWWTRSNSSSYVQNAITDWGCGECQKCDISPFEYLWHSDPFTPGWSGNRSYTYVYTTGGGTVWPALQAVDWSAPIVGGNHGTAVIGGSQYPLQVLANFYN